MDAGQFRRTYEESAAEAPERLLQTARNTAMPSAQRLGAFWRFLQVAENLAAKEFLIGEGLDDSDLEIRRWAVRLASTIGSTDARLKEKLRVLLAGESNPHKRSEIFAALAFMGDDSIAQECLALMMQPHKSPPMKAMVALGRIDTDEARGFLEQLMKAHPHPFVRQDATVRLASKGHTEAIAVLEARLADDLDMAERAWIAFTLAAIGNRNGYREARRILGSELDAHHEEIAFAIQDVSEIGEQVFGTEDLAERRTLLELWLDKQQAVCEDAGIGGD